MSAGAAFERVEAALRAVGSRTNGHGMWTCPAHEDSTPSLSVTNGNEGALLRCFADCSLEAVLERLRLAKSDLFDEPRRKGNDSAGSHKPHRVAEYLYVDRDGEPLRRKVRLEPGYKGDKKTFFWEKPNGRGGWVKCGKGEGNPHVLYNLPEVLESEQVHLCEGEKGAERIRKAWGACATCLPTPKWEPGFADALRDKDVLIWADRDAEGLTRAARAYRTLVSVARSVRVVQSRVETHKADAFDHIAVGYRPDDAIELDPSTLPSVEESAKEAESQDGEDHAEARAHALALRFSDDETRIDTWFDESGALRPVAERKYLVEEFIPEEVPAFVVARGGTGKGHFEVSLACSLALGVHFGSFAVKRPRGVVIVSREDDREELQRRFGAWSRAAFPSGLDLEQVRRLRENLRFVDLFGVRGARLGDALVRQIVETVKGLHAPGLVILDPLGKLLPEDLVSLNSQEGAGLVHEWLDVIVHEADCTTLVAHHVNKQAVKDGKATAGSATGSQMLEDLARFVLALDAVEGDEIVKYGLNPFSRYGYVSLVLTKANYSPALGEPFIFERMAGGALIPREALRPADLNAERALRVLEAEGPLSREDWEKACQELDPPLSIHDARKARTRLRADGLVVSGALQAPSEEKRSGRKKTLFRPSDTAPRRDQTRFKGKI